MDFKILRATEPNYRDMYPHTRMSRPENVGTVYSIKKISVIM